MRPNIQTIALLCAVCLANDIAVAQPVSRTPAETVERLLSRSAAIRQDDLSQNPDTEPDEFLVAAIIGAPSDYVRPIEQALQLPATLDELDPESPDFGPRLRRFQGAIRLSGLLGRELAEPLLVRFFGQARSLYERAAAVPEDAHSDRQPRKPGTVSVARLPSKVRSQLGLGGLMSSAITTAARVDSDILIGPVLQFWEAGYTYHQSEWLRYIVKEGGDDHRITERLKDLLSNLATERLLRWEIAQALGPIQNFDPASMLALMDAEEARLHRENLWPPQEPFTPDPAKLQPYQPPARPPHPDPAPTQPPGVG